MNDEMKNDVLNGEQSVLDLQFLQEQLLLLVYKEFVEQLLVILLEKKIFVEAHGLAQNGERFDEDHLCL
jgi:hypothetical protein